MGLAGLAGAGGGALGLWALEGPVGLTLGGGMAVVAAVVTRPKPAASTPGRVALGRALATGGAHWALAVSVPPRMPWSDVTVHATDAEGRDVAVLGLPARGVGPFRVLGARGEPVPSDVTVSGRTAGQAWTVSGTYAPEDESREELPALVVVDGEVLRWGASPPTGAATNLDAHPPGVSS